MAKIKKNHPPVRSETGIKAVLPDEGTLKFSFKLFDSADDEVCPKSFKDGYTRTLMELLRDLSTWKVSEFTGPTNKTIRNHRIDWADTQRPDGFKNLNVQYQDYQPWQFSLSANEHGRVHGLLIGECFYLVWLDCNHVVYS